MGWMLISNLFAAKAGSITNHPGFDRMDRRECTHGQNEHRERQDRLSASRPTNGLRHELLVAQMLVGLAIVAQLNVDDA